jgi:hypothetical protein
VVKSQGSAGTTGRILALQAVNTSICRNQGKSLKYLFRQIRFVCYNNNMERSPQLTNSKPMANLTSPKPKALTFGQQKAGLSLKYITGNTNDKVIQTCIHFANIFDTLYADMQTSDEERERLAKIALDENINTMRVTLRALTFGR